MKHHLHQLFQKSLTLILLLFVSFSVWSQSQQKYAHSATLISEKSDSYTIKFELNKFDLVEVETQRGAAYLVSSPQAPNFLKEGAPDLFYLTRSVIIPDQGSMQVEIIPGAFEEIKGIEIAPSKGNLTRNIDPSSVPYTWGEVYKKDAFYPENLAELRSPYIMRDFRGQSIDIYPVQYNPVTKTLRVYSEITVIVKHNSTAGVNELNRTRPLKGIDPEFAHVYDHMFLNYRFDKYPILEEEGDLLIIAFDDFMDAMKPFVNWKRTIGRKTTIVPKSVAGSTSTAIKNYIVDFYNNPDNNLTYVLLVGDAPQIPAGNISGSGNSDNYYGYVLGNDSYNELFIGRFSAENVGHVQTQVQRMIEYERDLTTTDTWLNIGMGIARNEGTGQGHNGENDYQHMDFIRDTLLNYTYVTVYREYDGNVPGVTNTTAAQISSGLNNGVSIINFCNHGSVTGWSVGNYSISHVNALTNVGKLPFIWSVACVNGDFVTNFCFAEAWMRATHNDEPTGAIGTMMSTINQAWQPPQTGQDEMVGILAEGFANNIKRTFGGTSINGSMKMLDVHGASGKETHDTWVLFGDPTLMVRTDIPQDMIVSHNPTLFLGSSTFTVNCDTDDAIVAISYEDNDGEVHLLASTKVEGGVASITFDEPITTPVDLIVAVFAYNKVTYLGAVAAVPADEPYVVLKSFETTATPNYGQSFGINIVLQNISEDPYTASGVVAQISSDSPYITIINNSVNAGTIVPDQEVSLTNAFAVTLSDNVPNQTNIVFNITITGTYDSESYEWAQIFSFKALAPVLKIGGITIDDDGEGIPGILDPGETANAVISVSNVGNAASTDITAILTTISEYITIEGTPSISLGVLEAGASTSAVFSISADIDTPLETAATLTLGVDAGNYSDEKDLTIIIGYIPEYNMANTTVTACIGKFYDSGGPNGDYANSENFTMTFYPASATASMLFNFNSFNVESNYDFLYIYDGENASAPQFPGSPFTGTNSPGTIMATNETGAITFKFTSDNIVVRPGWFAEFFCVDLSVPPACAINPSPAVGAVVGVSPLTLSWSFVPGALEYDVYLGEETLPSEPTATVSTNSYNAELLEYTSYVWKVVPKNDAGEAQSCAVWNFTTEDIATTIIMHTGTVTACNALFYDSGGPDANYQNNENFTLTVFPAFPTGQVRITFSAFDVENSYDYLKIYNGTSASAPLLANLTGTTLPNSYVADNEEGALTFVFTSDYTVNKLGWVAHLTCDIETVDVTFLVLNTHEEPVQGARVAVNPMVKLTDEDGIAVFDLPINSTYTYSITKDGHAAVSDEFEVEEEDIQFNITLVPYYTVYFIVTNTEGVPMAGANVSFDNFETKATNESGEVEFTPVFAGEDMIYAVSHGDCHAHSGTLNVVNDHVHMEIVLIPLSTDVTFSQSLSAYPNPFSDFITVSGAEQVARIEVVNILGQRVMIIQPNGEGVVVIPTNALNAGVYLINFTSQSGERVVRKMIKR